MIDYNRIIVRIRKRMIFGEFMRIRYNKIFLSWVSNMPNIKYSVILDVDKISQTIKSSSIATL